MSDRQMGNAPNLKSDTETPVESDVTDALLLKRQNLIMKLEELDAVISRINEEYSFKLREIQTQKKPLEEALYHIEALLRLDGQNVNRSVGIKENNSAPITQGSVTITDAAFGLLKQIRQPTHYKDIANKLQERNIYIPGKDPAATLLSRISRDNRFKRANKRGVYALSTWRIRRAKSKSTRKRKGKTTGKQVFF